MTAEKKNIDIDQPLEHFDDGPRVIMSEELEDLLSLNQIEGDKESSVLLASETKGETKLFCSFKSLSSVGDENSYHIELELSDPSSMLSLLNGIDEGFLIDVKDKINFKIKQCRLTSWDVFKDIDFFTVRLGVQGEIQF